MNAPNVIRAGSAMRERASLAKEGAPRPVDQVRVTDARSSARCLEARGWRAVARVAVTCIAAPLCFGCGNLDPSNASTGSGGTAARQSGGDGGPMEGSSGGSSPAEEGGLGEASSTGDDGMASSSSSQGGGDGGIEAMDGSTGTRRTGECGDMPSGAMLPFAEGNHWVYLVTDNDDQTQSEKTTTVQGLTPIGYGENKDLLVHKVLTTKKDGADKTISWQEAVGDRVVRYREDSYSVRTGELKEIDFWSPYRLHADGSEAHTVAKAVWQDVYLETKEPVEGAASKGVKTDDTWDVESDYTCMEVPAGTGENGPIAEGKYPAVKFRKTTAGNTKYYWYVRGIGKIREEGTGQIEQLVSFTLKKK